MSKKMKEIEDEIKKDSENWYKSDYEGKLPVWYVSVFKRAVMIVPIEKLKMSAKYISLLLKKEKFNNADVRVINNAISACPISVFSESSATALKQYEAFNNLCVDLNIATKEMEDKLSQKKANLIKLSGVTLGRKPLIVN